MKLTQLVITGAGLVAALPSVAAAAPAWCGGATFDGLDLSRLNAQDPRDVVTTLAKATCAPNDEAKAAAGDIEKARQAWGRKLGMTDADWADAVAYAKVDRNNIKLDYSAKSIDKLSPIDQYGLISSGSLGDRLYAADALEPTLTEVGRLAIIQNCARDSTGTEFFQAEEMPIFAICQTDVKRFDPAKFAADVRSDTAHSPQVRMMLRFEAADLPERNKVYNAFIAKTLKQDAIYQKMFDLAEQARTEWTSTVAPNKELLALVTALDSATVFNSRSAFEGCESKVDAALAAAASKLPAKSFEKMMDVKDDPVNGFGKGAMPVFAADPIVHLAASAYVMCKPGSALSEFLMTAIEERPGARGPRVAAISKLGAAKLQPDNMDTRLRYPGYSSRPYSFSHGAAFTWGGVIKTLKPGPDGTLVTFQKETIKQQNCAQEHPSRQIDHIQNNGAVIYESICDKWVTETIDRTPGDQTIEATFAKVLKPGERVSIVYNNDAPLVQLQERRSGEKHKHGDKLPGAVIATWATKAATLPNSVLGAPIK